jgi:hypothetical protein
MDIYDRRKIAFYVTQRALVAALTVGSLIPPECAAVEAAAGWRFEEVRRVPAAEARQGVAADATHLYAIGNHSIGKYRKDTGERVAHWECPEGQPLIHVNAGRVIGGQLFGAHSNYPVLPHRSSVEIWETGSLQHQRSIDLGETDGSLTWIDRHNGNWIACFVHYAGRGGVPGRGPEFTRLVELDDDWQLVRAWRLPSDLIADLGGRGYSLSGGAIGPKGLLYVTGHDETELHVLQFPATGDELRRVTVIPIPAEGQAFAWDPTDPHVLHLILKRKREIITGRLLIPDGD